MVDITNISDTYATAPQLSVDDVAELASKGFSSVICYRPDDEGPGQTNFAEIEAACQANGMKCAHVPVVPGKAGPDDVKATIEALSSSPLPIIGYCASGMRAKLMFEAANK